MNADILCKKYVGDYYVERIFGTNGDSVVRRMAVIYVVLVAFYQYFGGIDLDQKKSLFAIYLLTVHFEL